MALAPNAVGPNLGAELLLDTEAQPGRRVDAGRPAAGGPARRGRRAGQRRQRRPHRRAGPAALAAQLRRPQPADGALPDPVHAGLGRRGRGGAAGDHVARGRQRPPRAALGRPGAPAVHARRAGLGGDRLRQPARRRRAAQPAERHRHRGDPDGGRLLRPALARPRPPAGPPGLPAAGGQPAGRDRRAGGRGRRRWWRPGYGPSGAAVGILIGEVVAAAHARWAAVRAWSGGARPAPARRRRAGWPRCAPTACSAAASARSAAPSSLDLVVASVSLSMVAVLQNIDVLVVGRDNPGHSGAYAAVSVTSKAIVFGAIVLGGYLLPEAAIRWRQGGHALRAAGRGARAARRPVGAPAGPWPWPRPSSCSSWSSTTPTRRPPTRWPRWCSP